MVSTTFSFLLCFISSSSKQNTSSSIWDSCEVVQLQDIHASLLLPRKFKKTSKYKLRQDLPLLNSDQELSEKILLFLEAFEFNDSSIDVFYENGKELNLVTLINNQRMAFDSHIGNQLKAVLNAYYQEIAQDSKVSIQPMDNYIKHTDKLQMMKFKHKIELIQEESTSYYQSIFFINTPIQLFVVKQISLEESDIENYLWSLKD